VAQLGSALDWGSRGRRFKSCQPDCQPDRVSRNDPDVQFADEELDVGTGVAAADADVVQAAVVA
jgi:hypothetical protein